MLQFTNYRKSYDNTEIISISDLKLEHGIYWLKGTNGSGKTTLIRSIAGLIPYEGNIQITGTDIKQNRIAYTSVVNYAEAEPVYPGFLTGNDLTAFYKESKNAPSGQLEVLSNKLGIAAYSSNKTATYSSGMAKKLSLVLGFLGNPKLILLDEPLITLDTASVAILQKMIREHYETGVTFIITSHQEIHINSAAMQQLEISNKTLHCA
jgi:ABC-2 type transport system ATP-binding protein